MCLTSVSIAIVLLKSSSSHPLNNLKFHLNNFITALSIIINCLPHPLLQASCIRAQKEEEMDKAYTVLDLFKTPRLRKITLLLIVMWMAISLVFDGHVRNVGSLGLDIFLTFTIASATEFPADTFLTLVLDVWGRRWLACGSMVLSGIFSLLATTVPYGKSTQNLVKIRLRELKLCSFAQRKSVLVLTKIWQNLTPKTRAF